MRFLKKNRNNDNIINKDLVLYKARIIEIS